MEQHCISHTLLQLYAQRVQTSNSRGTGTGEAGDGFTSAVGSTRDVEVEAGPELQHRNEGGTHVGQDKEFTVVVCTIRSQHIISYLHHVSSTKHSKPALISAIVLNGSILLSKVCRCTL